MSNLKFKDPSTGNWITIAPTAGGVPSGGTTGQVLKKTSGGYGWEDFPIIHVSPPSNLSISDCLTWATTNYPDAIDIWSEWSAATYTPEARDSHWAYILITAHSFYSYTYPVFFAIDTSSGKVYLAKEGSNSMWLKIYPLDYEDVNVHVVSTAPTSSSPDGLYFVV